MKRLRIILQIVLASTALLTDVSAQSEPKQPLAVEIEAPVGTAYRPGYPFPIRLTLNNYRPVFTGTVTIATSTNLPQPLVVLPISIGPGTFTFDLAPSIPQDGVAGLTIDVSHINGSVIYRTERLLSRTPAGSAHVLIAADRKIQKEIGAILAPRPPPPGMAKSDDSNPYRPRPFLTNLRTNLGALPTSWSSLAMFEYLIWDGTEAEGLSRQQRQALADWVYMGGTLLICGNSGTLEIPSPSPMLFAETIRTDDIPSAGLELLHGYGSTIISRAQDREQSLSSTVNPSSSELSTTAEFDDLATMPTYSEFGKNDETIESELRQALAKSVGYAEHTFYPLLILGLLYVVCIAVLDPIILSSLKITWATWITMPALTVLFSIAAALVFRSSGVAPVGHAYVQIIDVLPDNSAREISMDCIRTPARQFPSLNLKPNELAMARDLGTAIVPHERGHYPQRSPTIVRSYTSGEIKATLTGGSAYTFLHRKRPLGKYVPKINVDGLKKTGEYLGGKVTFTTPVRPIFAFIYWEGWFYELDSNLKIVRRSMEAADKQLINRLTANLPNSIENAGELGLARLAEQASRISISGAAAGNAPKQENKKQRHHTLSALAPALPAGYGIICVVSSGFSATEKSNQPNTQAVTCYRQLFQAP